MKHWDRNIIAFLKRAGNLHLSQQALSLSKGVTDGSIWSINLRSGSIMSISRTWSEVNLVRQELVRPEPRTKSLEGAQRQYYTSTALKAEGSGENLYGGEVHNLCCSGCKPQQKLQETSDMFTCKWRFLHPIIFSGVSNICVIKLNTTNLINKKKTSHRVNFWIIVFSLWLTVSSPRNLTVSSHDLWAGTGPQLKSGIWI